MQLFCFRKTILAGIVFLFSVGASHGHDPGLSSLRVELKDREVEIVLTFNESDVAGIAGEEAGRPTDEALRTLAGRALTFHAGEPALQPFSVDARREGENNVEFRYQFRRPDGVVSYSLESRLLPELSFGHRQALVVVEGDGRETFRSLLSGRDARFAFVPAAGSSATTEGFWGFFRLGLHHIITGYDHLLFLFGLLLVCHRMRSALLLITAFTVAHSLTLALSVFGLVDLPGRLVEAVIAASILYVGLENLIRRGAESRWRVLLCFSFGLVHGLGFAGVLHEMGIAQTGAAAAVPLLAFNAGVEAGQLGIAALLLPLLWALRRRPAFLRMGVPVLSLLVAGAGAWWLLERVFSQG